MKKVPIFLLLLGIGTFLTAAQSAALIQLSQAYQALGQYRQALADLQMARVLAEHAADQTQIAIVLGGLGNVYSATGPIEKAKQHLHETLHLAKQLGNASLTTSTLNNFGNLFTSQNRPHDAFDAYRKRVGFATQAGEHTLVARVVTNAAMVVTQDGQYQTAKALIDESFEQTQVLGHSHDEVWQLTRQAIFAAQQVHAPESLYRWQWQTGRLLKAQERVEAELCTSTVVCNGDKTYVHSLNSCAP